MLAVVLLLQQHQPTSCSSKAYTTLGSPQASPSEAINPSLVEDMWFGRPSASQTSSAASPGVSPGVSSRTPATAGSAGSAPSTSVDRTLDQAAAALKEQAAQSKLQQPTIPRRSVVCFACGYASSHMSAPAAVTASSNAASVQLLCLARVSSCTVSYTYLSMWGWLHGCSLCPRLHSLSPPLLMLDVGGSARIPFKPTYHTPLDKSQPVPPAPHSTPADAAAAAGASPDVTSAAPAADTDTDVDVPSHKGAADQGAAAGAAAPGSASKASPARDQNTPAGAVEPWGHLSPQVLDFGSASKVRAACWRWAAQSSTAWLHKPSSCKWEDHVLALGSPSFAGPMLHTL